MKNTIFIGLTLTAILSTSAFVPQTTNAESTAPSTTFLTACKVKKNNANFFVSETEKNMKLKKGTSLSWTIPDLHQGLIVVNAKIGKKWVKGEILLDDTTCR